MALIEDLMLKDQDRNGPHRAVEATYCVFDQGGQRYLQINTYGSPERQHAGAASQTIQLNEKSAAALLAVIKREFRLA